MRKTTIMDDPVDRQRPRLMPLARLRFPVLLAVLLGTVRLIGAEAKPPLALAYFVPSDRAEISGYVERLDRVMTEVQRFYRDGMVAAGYGPLTFGQPRDARGKLEVHLVRGNQPMRAYGRNDSERVRREVARALSAEGVDVNRRTLVIFQVLLDWNNGVADEVGPYAGAGDHLAGTAWVYDDALLDPLQLGSKSPGGFYQHPCSIGEFNSHYIGGVAHELGHAFGLPHVAGPASNPKHSLMGDGNHTYGQELRGEGAGTYLHPASAMLLARSRPFSGNLAGAGQAPECEFVDYQASFTNGEWALAGRIDSRPPVFGLVAYQDSLAIRDDYDAVGWTCPVNAAGEFRLALRDLQPGEYELRFQFCHTNGASRRQAFRWRVDARGVPDNQPFSRGGLLLEQAVRAYARHAPAQVETLVHRLETECGDDSDRVRQAVHLRHLLHPNPPESLASVEAGEKEAAVSRLVFADQLVGWGFPLRDQVLVEGGSCCFLRVDGKVHERGLFAHAASRYVLELPSGPNGWKNLAGSFGLQDGHDGSVVFVVRGDGRDLFRSGTIRDHQLHPLRVEVTGIRRLELVVEDAGDGATNDWGVWIEPTLHR